MATKTSDWSGLCLAGKHGLDFEGQPCDLCPPQPAARMFTAADRDALVALLDGLDEAEGSDLPRHALDDLLCTLAVAADNVRDLLDGAA